MIEYFTVLKIAKNCHELPEHSHPWPPPTEQILREGLQRLPHSVARSKSEQPGSLRSKVTRPNAF